MAEFSDLVSLIWDVADVEDETKPMQAASWMWDKDKGRIQGLQGDELRSYVAKQLRRYPG
jgi:hypothetical protein